MFLGGLSSTDILGHTHWLGSLPDRGAYESAFNDATQYSGITAADSGISSLRDDDHPGERLAESRDDHVQHSRRLSAHDRR